MPKVTRFLASKGLAPVTALKADFSLPQVPTSLAKQSTAGAKALGEVGETLTRTGAALKQKIDRDNKVKKELARRNQNAIDSTAEADAVATTTLADLGIKDDISDPRMHTDEWDAKFEQRYGEASRRINELSASPATKQSMLTQLNLDKEVAFAKLQLLKTTTNVDRAEVATATAYESAVVNNRGVGPVADAGLAYRESLVAKYGEAEATKIFNEQTEKAHDERKKKLVETMRSAAVASPNAAIGQAQDEIDLRRRGEGQIPEDDVSNEQLNSIMQFSRSVLTSRGNAIETQYNTATGQATTDWTESIVKGTITEDEVWTTKIPVDQSKETDVGSFKKSWATVARGIVSRNKDILEGKNKDARAKAYDPALVADLKTRARKAKSSIDVASIKLLASTALTEHKINADDLETINVNAEKTFDTVLDRDLETSMGIFKNIQLKGSSATALAPWMQAQFVGARESGRPLTSEQSKQLIVTFQSVAEAKEWSIGQVGKSVEASLAKIDNPTLQDQRKVALTAQRTWLGKTDTELVEEYKVWLRAKP